MYNKNYIPQTIEIYCRPARLIQKSKINYCNSSPQQTKEKSHTITSVSLEQIFDKVKHPLIIKKKLSKIEYRATSSAQKNID
jgi:hypothetical protein